MIRNVTLAALVLMVAAGCRTDAVYKEKAATYRPDISGRYLGSRSKPDVAVKDPVPNGAQVSGQTRTMLKRGDKITIYIYGTGKPTQLEDVIDDNGGVNLPYVGSVKIGGKTTSEAESYIEKTYIDGGIYKQIQVSVVKLFEGEFYVRGEVNNKQGVFPLSGDTTLLEAIARAGGPTVFAKLTKVKLIRNGKVTYYNVKKMEAGEEKPPLLKPSDIIIIDKSAW